MDMIKVGVIVNTQGLKGTLKVKSFTDFKDERYKSGNTLYIDFKHELIPVTVSKFRTNKNLEYIDFKEYNHINEVEKYKGSTLFMSKENKHDLPSDEFYFTELIGMEVFTSELVGICTDVREVPQGELLVVKREGKKNALIPFNKQFIKDVNKLDNVILLHEWEGLL
jgi:16S rRNA processing protein RimM